MAFFRNENFWLYLPLIAWICGILYFSSSKGSISNTSVKVVPLLTRLFPRNDGRTFEKHHFVLRKLLHFFGYAVLALFASIVFYNSSLPAATNFWYLCTFTVVVIVASTDEIRQSFYPERVGSLSDVALDCCGGLTMIWLFYIFVASRSS